MSGQYYSEVAERAIFRTYSEDFHDGRSRLMTRTKYLEFVNAVPGLNQDGKNTNELLRIYDAKVPVEELGLTFDDYKQIIADLARWRYPLEAASIAHSHFLSIYLFRIPNISFYTINEAGSSLSREYLNSSNSSVNYVDLNESYHDTGYPRTVHISQSPYASPVRNIQMRRPSTSETNQLLNEFADVQRGKMLSPIYKDEYAGVVEDSPYSQTHSVSYEKELASLSEKNKIYENKILELQNRIVELEAVKPNNDALVESQRLTSELQEKLDRSLMEMKKLEEKHYSFKRSSGEELELLKKRLEERDLAVDSLRNDLSDKSGVVKGLQAEIEVLRDSSKSKDAAYEKLLFDFQKRNEDVARGKDALLNCQKLEARLEDISRAKDAAEKGFVVASTQADSLRQDVSRLKDSIRSKGILQYATIGFLSFLDLFAFIFIIVIAFQLSYNIKSRNYVRNLAFDIFSIVDLYFPAIRQIVNFESSDSSCVVFNSNVYCGEIKEYNPSDVIISDNGCTNPYGVCGIDELIF